MDSSRTMDNRSHNQIVDNPNPLLGLMQNSTQVTERLAEPILEDFVKKSLQF